MSHYLLFFILLFIAFGFYRFTQKYGTQGGYQHPKWLQILYNTLLKRKIVVFISFISRLVIPIYLFQYLHPINAMLINQIIIDNIDPIYLVNVESPLYNRNIYQSWDKVMDIWGYLCSLYPVLYGSVSPITQNILIGLLVYRIIGVVVWFAQHNESVFIRFPDFYTAIYYVLFGCQFFHITNTSIITFLIVLSIYLKLLHEQYNH